jgi:hypothetical protein
MSFSDLFKSIAQSALPEAGPTIDYAEVSQKLKAHNTKFIDKDTVKPIDPSSQSLLFDFRRMQDGMRKVENLDRDEYLGIVIADPVEVGNGLWKIYVDIPGYSNEGISKFEDITDEFITSREYMAFYPVSENIFKLQKPSKGTIVRVKPSAEYFSANISRPFENKYYGIYRGGELLISRDSLLTFIKDNISNLSSFVGVAGDNSSKEKVVASGKDLIILLGGMPEGNGNATPAVEKIGPTLLSDVTVRAYDRGPSKGNAGFTADRIKKYIEDGKNDVINKYGSIGKVTIAGFSAGGQDILLSYAQIEPLVDIIFLLDAYVTIRFDPVQINTAQARKTIFLTTRHNSVSKKEELDSELLLERKLISNGAKNNIFIKEGWGHSEALYSGLGIPEIYNAIRTKKEQAPPQNAQTDSVNESNPDNQAAGVAASSEPVLYSSAGFNRSKPVNRPKLLLIDFPVDLSPSVRNYNQRGSNKIKIREDIRPDLIKIKNILNKYNVPLCCERIEVSLNNKISLMAKLGLEIKLNPYSAVINNFLDNDYFIGPDYNVPIGQKFGIKIYGNVKRSIAYFEEKYAVKKELIDVYEPNSNIKKIFLSYIDITQIFNDFGFIQTNASIDNWFIFSKPNKLIDGLSYKEALYAVYENNGENIWNLPTIKWNGRSFT